MKEYDRREERTGVQESSDFDPIFDVQSDFVMVYGFKNLKERVKKWKARGYVIHLMTGVSWGEYQDYLYGKFDGIDHHDEGQRRRDGREKAHGVDIPYMVPSNSFAHYLASGLKLAVDCGVEAIHLEEPEFWVESGYSDAFKREWKIYYKEDWQDPQSSADAQYRASKLKQYLYTRTLDRLCSELKEYAMVKYGRLLRFYVPTHSLINYTQWKIVSPESALVDLPTVDGYIAQIWTGTSRTRNIYRGVKRERTFETAFLEYGVMQELVRGTGRRMWYLADPIEDDPRHSWKDYRENYYRTVTASLFHPEISDFEVSPWPARVMKGKHREKGGEHDLPIPIPGNLPTSPEKDHSERVRIPAEYKTNLLSVMHTLRDMADQPDFEWISHSPEVGILMADSAMFQRFYPEGDPEAREAEGDTFSPFYGLALPLLKSGICARPIQLDNIRRYPGYADAYGTLVLSYEYMKPSAPDIHQALAGWVRAGGTLVYVGDGSDSFHSVREWWNQGGNTYRTPAEHLMEALGLPRVPENGLYSVGAGRVQVIQNHPSELARIPELSDAYLDCVRRLVTDDEPSAALILRRGAYYVTAVMDETPASRPAELKGCYINLYDENLSVIEDPILEVGSVGLWYDTARIDKSAPSELIALSGRAEKLVKGQRSLSFVSRSPSEMTVACRIWTKRPPKSVRAGGKELSFEYEPDSETTCFTYPSEGEKIPVKVLF
ncbi:MAG: hypothetical protein ACI3YK_06160 [Eubacteriales bacterium]